MRALVLGGSVFVGKRLVRALLAQDARRRRCSTGARRPRQLPDGVEHLVADRTDTASMRAALGDRSWDAVFDVSGFVMAAGGSNIGEPAGALRRPGRGLRVRAARSWPTTNRSPASSRGREDLPSNPDGVGTYGGFKAVAEQADARASRRHRLPGFGRAAGRDLRAGQQHLRHGDADVPAPPPVTGRSCCPTAGWWPRSYGHVDDLCELMVAMVGQPAARGEIFNVTAEVLTSLRYVRSWPPSSAPIRTSSSCPTTCCRPCPTGVRPPLRRPAPRHRQHREGHIPARLPSALRLRRRPRATPTPGSGSRAGTTPARPSATRSGEPAGTSRPRPRSRRRFDERALGPSGRERKSMSEPWARAAKSGGRGERMARAAGSGSR